MARVYATQQQYRDWSGDTAATVSDALLARASLIIDDALKGAVYDVDPATLMPTDANITEALMEATCAQIQWWDEIGDTTGAGAGAQFQSASIGSASYTKGYSAAGSKAGNSGALAPMAFTTLEVAGLLTSTVYTNG